MEPDLFVNNDLKNKVDPVDTSVGKRLKMRRIMLGLSQNDLGDAVNVSIQQIQKYEKATNRISSGRLYAFAKLLMVPLEYFFQDVEKNIKSEVIMEERDAFASDVASEKELLSLIRSYSEIKDVAIRKKIIDLVKTLSSKHE